ncbi:MAG: hypothetical protein PVJ09_02865 [Candidatus Woesebacteria bacterium]|jgi:hypothetical protein
MLLNLISKVYAQNTGVSELDLSKQLKLNTTEAVADKYDNPMTLINLLVPTVFVIAGIIFFILIIVAGYKYIAKGQKGIDEAKSLIGAAVAGFMLMFAAYWIIQIIKGITGADIPI